MVKKGFYQQVYEIVAQIPPGEVLTYGQIARILGNPRAARQVGWAMRKCPADLPWHRVVRADGKIVCGADTLARELLVKEGAVFLPDGRIYIKN